MNSWHSYPSIFNLGHRAVASLLSVPVNVEEKIDGSQFSFGITEEGEIKVRSKGAVMHPDAPEKMFSKAVDTVKSLAPQLVPGWTYRAEYLAKPKHNTLCYDRAPDKHIIVFDINTGEEAYLGYAEKKAEADRLGLECVRLIFAGTMTDLAEFRTFLDCESALGGQKIEGVVVKPSEYNLYAPDKKVLMGKFVSEAFREFHGQEWKKENPNSGDILDRIGSEYQTRARWHKAIQHLQEAGRLEGSPRDIGLLMKEVPADIEKECVDEIKGRLFAWAWPSIRRMSTHGLPEFYKDQLLKQQFEAVGEPTAEPESNDNNERIGRPRLAFDRLSPLVDQVVNDVRQNPPEPAATVAQ
jgi:hypothetical protein